MTKPFEFHGVEAEKKEAMRRYNNRRSFLFILRAAAVALLCYLWFPTVAILLQTTGDWFLRTGAVIITNRSVVFVFANLIIVLIYLLSRDKSRESSDTEPDLYNEYTTSSAAMVTATAEKVEDDDDDSKKQIVPAFIAEVEEVVVVEADREAVTTDLNGVYSLISEKEELNRKAVTTDVKGIYRRTKSETKKERFGPVTVYRRTESAKVPIERLERLSSEEFRLKVETFIMEKKRTIVQENVAVQCEGHRFRPALVGGAATGYGSC